MKKTLLRLTVLTLAVFLLSSCNRKDPYAPPSGMVAASDERASFCLFVPDGWVVDYSTAAAGAYFSPADPSSVSVMAWDLEHTDTSLDDWWTTNESELSLVFRDVVVESSENTTVNGLYAKKYVYSASLGEFSYRIMQVACIQNTDVYLFTYTSTPENYESHLEDVDQILTHLTIK